MKLRRMLAQLAAVAVFPAYALAGDSYFVDPPNDTNAIFLTPDKFPVHADGAADDSEALQQAIDKIQETRNQGILFVPSGRYRVTRTIYIWPGIRIFGYGKTRPVIVLGSNTEGFQQGPRYMIFFAGGRPGKDKMGQTPPDASPGTFYSAMSNVDIEIGDGNPGAVAIRAHYAQHCYLAHMDFHVGSGLAGIHDGGNVARDLHFFGGKYGIWTRKPSPGWQFTILDSSFEGQSEAAIREHEAGLTLIRPQFKNVPVAVSVDPGYFDELWIKDARLENVSDAGVVISDENSRGTEINVENSVCRGVPVFASFRESGKKMLGSQQIYAVKTFSHGLHFDDLGAAPDIRDVLEIEALNALPE